MSKRRDVTRPATDDEIRQCRPWLEMAQGPIGTALATVLTQGLDDGILGQGAGRSFTEPAHTKRIAEWCFAGDLESPILYRTSVHVATHRGEVAGMCVAGPPRSYLFLLVDAAPPEEKESAYFSGLLYLSKLAAVAVAPSYRGRGFGRALVAAAARTARSSGATILYGQFDRGRNLGEFYRAQRFTVHAPGEPVDISSEPRLSTTPHPAEGDIMFSRPL